MHRPKGVPKYRHVQRTLTDADVEAAMRLATKWSARMTVLRDGQVIVRVH